MKRFLCLLLSAVLLLTSCSANNQQKKLPNIVQKLTEKVTESKENKSVETEAKVKNYSKAVGLTDNNGYNVKFLKDIGFDTVILKISGIRSAIRPYKTDFEELSRLKRVTSDLDSFKMKYIIEVTSGPGYSSDGAITTLYSKEIERIYFSQMVGEILKRYAGNKNFKGMSIKLDNPDIPVDEYYNTENYIINKARETYPQVTIIYNLHPLTFEKDLNNLPVMTNDKNILNLTIYFKGIVYPGYGAGYKTSVNLDKNGILKRLQAIKEFETKNKQHIMITVQTPWAEKSDVFLQDTFEIFKMIGFDYSICYANSSDIFDFSKNEDIINVLKRHSK